MTICLAKGRIVFYNIGKKRRVRIIMTREELEKYIYEEVEITFKVPGLREFTHKGKLVKEKYVFHPALGVEASPDWFALIFENKKYYSFHFEEVKEIKKVMKDKLTEVEKIILENTDKCYKYIARDDYGDLLIFVSKPSKRLREWNSHYGWHEFQAFNHLFKNIKWEDKEPYKFR